jgi:hypothetical protein
VIESWKFCAITYTILEMFSPCQRLSSAGAVVVGLDVCFNLALLNYHCSIEDTREMTLLSNHLCFRSRGAHTTTDSSSQAQIWIRKIFHCSLGPLGTQKRCMVLPSIVVDRKDSLCFLICLFILWIRFLPPLSSASD